ncbi:transposase IS3/IS911 family protein [Mycobacterium tuberculosis]|nr:transposase IS3/IS911 family protein [Mycobacterium tuberculosis]
MARQRRHFTQEHKDEIVRMVLDGPRPIAHVAREVGIHDTTLGNWVKEYRKRHGGDSSATSAGEPKSPRERELERECVYLAVMSLDPTGTGRKRWMRRWKPALNAFDIAFEGRLAAARN